MADNVQLNAGSGGAVLAADDIGPGVWHQRVKVEFGPDGSAADVHEGNPLPTRIGDGTDQVVVSAAGGMSVEVTAALPAGTNNIGDVDVLSLPALPAGTNNIGDVDVLSLPALPAGTNNIGDVDIVSHPSELHQADFDTGAGTQNRHAVGVIVPAAGGAAVVPGDTANGLDVDVTRVQGRVDVNPISGQTGITGGAGAVAANTPRMTLASDDPAVVALQVIDDWDETDRCKVSPIAGQAGVQGGAGAVTASTQRVAIATDANVVALAAGTNTNEVVGDVAADAPAAGNPVSIGGIAETAADSAPGSRVSADGDATRIATDRDGAVYTHPHGPQVWSYHVDGSSALTDATVHAAPGAGLSLYVTDIVISKDAATAMNVFFEEGTTRVLGPFYLEAVAGRGLHIQFRTPKKITANTALTVTSSAAIAHAIEVTGYIAPA